MRRLMIWFVAGPSLAVSIAAFAAETNLAPATAENAAPAFTIKTWRMSDGLPSDRVHDILQTRDGYLWVATFNGLARFDGVHFTAFHDADSPGLQNSLINTLFEDSAGRLWVGSDTGEISWRDEQGFHATPLPRNWPSSPVDAFVENKDGAVLALNRDGVICAFTNGVVAWTLGSLDRIRYSELAKDTTGRVWALRRGGAIVELGNGKELDEAKGIQSGGFRNIAAARKGGLWVRIGNRVRRWENGHWAEDRGEQNWRTTTRQVNLFESTSGDLFAGTFNEGAFVISAKGAREQISRNNGLPHNLVAKVCEDGKHNIWLGTGAGLTQLRPPVLTMLNPEDLWRHRAVQTVTPGTNGSLWIGTADAGLYLYQSNRFQRFYNPVGGADQNIRSLLEDRSGVLWIGTQAGLKILQGDETVSAPGSEELPSLIYALHEARDGSLWAGTQNGVFVRRDGRWTRIDNSLSRVDVRCIVEQTNGVFWIGMRGGGVARFADGKFTQFLRTNGLPYNYVWSMLADAEGSVWIGTSGGGLARWHDGKFFNFTSRQGLPSDFICSILDDAQGNLWIASYGGIFRAAKADLDKCERGELSSITPFVLDAEDGLASLEMSGGNDPSGCHGANGKFYFPTSGGLAVVDPGEIHGGGKPPAVFIENILVDREPVNVSGSKLVVPPGSAQLEFRYSALDFSAPEQLRFKVRLKNVDRDWVEVGRRRTAYYTHVPPGKYEFQVIAANNEGVWNEHGAALTLELQPFFWQTWWFGPLCWLGGAALIGAATIVQLRRRHYRKLEALERARLLERERRRIAQDLHDDLGAGLTEIDSTSALAHETAANTEEARGYLREIGARSRELVVSMDEIVWAVNPHNDNLPAVTSYFCHYAEQFLRATPLRCRFEVPEKVPDLPLDAEQRHNLFLAFKESLNNAVRHSSGSEVRTSFVIEPRQIRIEVADDGRGVREKTNHPGADGLANMRQRLEKIGGSCEIAQRAEGGTRVSFILPLPPN